MKYPVFFKLSFLMMSSIWNILPYDVFCQHKLMNTEDYSRDVAEEEDNHYAAQDHGKISFSSARFTSSHVGVPGHINQHQDI